MAHILVVDDDADMRALVRGALERDGHAVNGAGMRSAGDAGALRLGALHPAGCDDAR